MTKRATLHTVASTRTRHAGNVGGTAGMLVKLRGINKSTPARCANTWESGASPLGKERLEMQSSYGIGNARPHCRCRDHKRYLFGKVWRDPQTGCWIWLGDLTTSGYGRLRHNGAHYQAHRFVYEELIGAVDPELVMDHLCRVRRCVNPRHLEPVTQRENLRRSPIANAGHAERCPRGHRYPPEGGRCRYCRAQAAWRRAQAKKRAA